MSTKTEIQELVLMHMGLAYKVAWEYHGCGTAQGVIQKKQAGGRDYAQIWNQCEGNS